MQGGKQLAKGPALQLDSVTNGGAGGWEGTSAPFPFSYCPPV